MGVDSSHFEWGRGINEGTDNKKRPLALVDPLRGRYISVNTLVSPKRMFDVV